MSRATTTGLSKKERKLRRRELRRRQREREARMRLFKRIGGATAAVLLVAVLGFAGYRWAAGTKIYPPTDVQGHTETVPPDHVLTSPMPVGMHKHMLEHADGNGPPGVIINYNCEDFDCAPDTIDRLAEIARAYPTFVYVAPYPGMDAKIAVTRFGQQELLDSVDEERIRAFIERR